MFYGFFSLHVNARRVSDEFVISASLNALAPPFLTKLAAGCEITK